MNQKHLAGVLMLTLSLACLPASAQTSVTPTATEQQKKTKKELERKALILLDEIIKDGQSFRVTENRLTVKALAASLLWKYDEARARILFKETMAGVVDLLNNQDGEEDTAVSRNLRGAPQLRRDLVQMLATRDARMAREFMRATRQTNARAVNGRDVEPDGDTQLEYGLATMISETDPKQALEIAEESLSKGFSYELIDTLQTLRNKDPEAAAKLAAEIVAKLRSENLGTNNEAANIAFNLLGMVFTSSAESDAKETKKATPLLDTQGMRDLMEMNINYALTSPNGIDRLRTLEGMMPEVQKYAPARVGELRRKMAQRKSAAKEMGEEGANAWEKYRVLIEKGTADELLAAATNAPPGIRESLYQSAATKLAEKGDVERAREIINDHVPEAYARKQMLAELDKQTSLTAAEQGKMDQVRKSLAALPTNEQRALTLAQLAITLIGKGEKKVARQLLTEAQSMVSSRAKNISQLGAQVMIAKAYVNLEPERSLSILEPIVDQLNELLAAAVTLGGFILEEEVMRDDEIRMELFMDMFPALAVYYAVDLRTLAIFDFDRTRALAERFQRDEVRTMARLLVVQSVLGEQTMLEMPAVETSGQRTMTTTTTTTTTSTDGQGVKDDGSGVP
jgi:hypothetical protein